MGGVGAQLPRYWYWSPFSYLQLCINLPSAGRVPTQQIKNPTDSAAVNLSFAQFFSFLDLKLSRNVDNVFSTWKWSQDNFDFVVQRFFFRINYCISIFFFFFFFCNRALQDHESFGSPGYRNNLSVDVQFMKSKAVRCLLSCMKVGIESA